MKYHKLLQKWLSLITMFCLSHCGEWVLTCLYRFRFYCTTTNIKCTVILHCKRHEKYPNDNDTFAR